MGQYPSTLTDGSWQDRAFVTIIRKEDQEKVDLHGPTTEFGFADGTRDFDGTPVSNGGRIREHTAEEDATFNATLYPVGASTEDYEKFDRPRGVDEFFYESGDLEETKDSVSEYSNSLTRKDYLYVVMWTDDPSVNSATDSVGDEYHAYRLINDNVMFIDVTPDFSDQVLQLEVEVKRTAFNPVGKPNFLGQEKVPEAEEELAEIGVDADGQFTKDGETVTYF